MLFKLRCFKSLGCESDSTPNIDLLAGLDSQIEGQLAQAGHRLAVLLGQDRGGVEVTIDTTTTNT